MRSTRVGGIDADWVTLRIFLAAVELGSIAKAATRCGIAPSAAAQRLRLLDAACGVALLERGARGIRATAAGEAMQQHARTLLELSARFAGDLHAFAGGGGGSVRLRATASVIAGQALCPMLATFRSTWPGVRLEVKEATSATVLYDLAEGRCDLGLITASGEVPVMLTGHAWGADRLILAVPGEHPLAGRPQVGFAEVLDHPLINVQGGGALSLLLASAARQLGRRMIVAAEVTGSDAARSLVAAGLGLAVMPEGLCHPGAAAGLVTVALDEPWAERALRLVARPVATLPPAARLLRDHLLDRASAGGAR